MGTMSEELEVIAGVAREVAATVSDERKATAVWRHPDRDAIEHLLRRGRSAFWVQAWLEERYPLVDEDDDGEEIEHADVAQHRRWQLGESLIEEYRRTWMPEHAAGVDVVHEDLEDLVGRRFPGAQQFELDVMEFGLHVAQRNLARALAADEKMGMLQQITLDANGALMSSAERLMAAKSKLGLPGYEAAPDRSIQEVHSTNKNLSLELHGRVGPDGKAAPGDPKAVSMMAELMKLPAAERAQLAAASRAVQATEIEDVDAGDVQGDVQGDVDP
jgi:hypothetical protein